MEVNACRKDQPFEIIPKYSAGNRHNSMTDGDSRDGGNEVPMDTDGNGSQLVSIILSILSIL